MPRTVTEFDFRQGYQTFETSAQDLICKPLEGVYDMCHTIDNCSVCVIEVLAGYEDLRSTASDTALRKFLTQVKVNAMQVLHNSQNVLHGPLL